MSRIDVEVDDANESRTAHASLAFENPTSGSGGKGGRLQALKNVILGFFMPVAILAGGGITLFYLLETSPMADRNGTGQRNARLVEVMPAQVTEETALVFAMGTVQPACRIELKPRVSGEIVEVSRELIPGGLFAEGEMVLRIDSADYDLIVRQRSGEVANAESAYRLEIGNQSVAKREYEILGETINEDDQDLVLRRPQLRTVEAALDVARAAMDKARLDLDRTTVRSPFNALITSRQVNLGAQVSGTTPIATLIGTDEYWIELSVPVDQLKWIQIPTRMNELGSKVRVFNEAAWGDTVYRTGHVLRLAGDLEDEGRMARLLVSVPDPLSILDENKDLPILILDSFVRVEIEGIPLQNVIAVKREFLRDGKNVWVMGDDGKLQVRTVTIAFRSRESVLITSGISPGERVVATDLAAPVSGMPLRLRDGEDPGSASIEASDSRGGIE
ncbi:MAG: efflux RND transporter periplasmic adaptor subunit [Planctomycetota bacterium]